MAQSVVVLSSQLITTLSALAYLRWRGLRGSRLAVVSLYRDDLSHSAKAFQPLLQGLAAQDGHHCRFITGDSALVGPEPRACSLLLLPRLDDREGQQMLRDYRASEVVELGESIGVETRLYSEQAQRNRIRALELLHQSHAMASVRQDPLVPFDRPVEPSRLQDMLNICASFRRAWVDAEAMPRPPAPSALICLPYLRVPKWRVRWRLLGRSFGWRWTLGIENRAYFRRAIRAGLRPLPADVPLWVQAHPKNETHHGLIERLLAPLRPVRSWELLPADDPLEVRLLHGWCREGSGRRPVLGFGTNLLAAAVFLAPHHRGVTLCQPAEKGWWWRCSDPRVNRREWRRSQHVGALLSNLLDALDQLQAQ
ncbi:hypothetical protein [Synechococcus sp. A15-44]|uniref:hypothetical protein n=1 Tax=Synechococcus sp. A15-44 TaxID=1050646 RepID=UPI001646D469|nr:hypothetical protein [Synechococcus sp. A15-44]QNI65968.1 hypothetical protein SynA1544_03057 [Synechococcus sp. A15-44]